MKFHILGTAIFCASLSLIPHAASAQQLIPKQTLEQCSARGGTIRTWTNTAGTYPNVGECYVPPSGGGGGYAGSVPSSGAKASAVLDLAAGAISVLDALQNPDTQNPVTESYEPPPPPPEPAVNGKGDGLFERGRKLSLINPCRAARVFELAASFYEQEGNTAQAQNAMFQASFNNKECAEKTARDGTSETGKQGYDKRGQKQEKAKKACAKTAPAQLRTNTYDVFREAKSECTRVLDEDNPEFKTCMHTKKAEIIVKYEPDIRSACRPFTKWPDSHENCVVYKYDKLWAEKVTKGAQERARGGKGGSGGAGDDNQDCADGDTGVLEAGNSPPAPQPDYKFRQSLRDKLKKMQAEQDAAAGTEAAAGETTAPPSGETAGELSADTAAAPAEPVRSASSDEDEAFENWKKGTGATPGYRNDGTFEPHEDMNGLEPTPEMRKEMREMLQDNSAAATFPR